MPHNSRDKSVKRDAESNVFGHPVPNYGGSIRILFFLAAFAGCISYRKSLSFVQTFTKILHYEEIKK